MPVPSDKLIARVAGGTDHASFFWSGRESVRELERTLGIVGRSLDSFSSVLDFGCGCGRMLLWLEAVGSTRALHGTDVDAEAVAWCREHIPYAQISVNDPDPPLPFSDGAFDLVFNHSVFTHIDEQRQDLWLSELRRVVRGGGLVVLSVHGEIAIEEGAWALRDQLERDGIAYLDKTFPAKIGLPDWYQNTWHAPWYIFEHWAHWFDIRAYVPGAALGLQDHVLLERRPEGRTPRTPLAARPRAVAEGRPATRVSQALAQTRAYRHGFAHGTSRRAPLRRLVRDAVLRAMRPYTVHEDSFDEAVSASIEDLTRTVDGCVSELRRIQGVHEGSTPEGLGHD